jgi:hypothetical protein
MHRIDCDMGEDCNCSASEEDLRARIATLEFDAFCHQTTVGHLSSLVDVLRADLERHKAGLRFYAHGMHYSGDEWEDVSGEPPNWLCNPHGDTVEDGSVAEAVLLNQESGPGWEPEDDWPPEKLPAETGAVSG